MRGYSIYCPHPDDDWIVNLSNHHRCPKCQMFRPIIFWLVSFDNIREDFCCCFQSQTWNVFPLEIVFACVVGLHMLVYFSLRPPPLPQYLLSSSALWQGSLLTTQKIGSFRISKKTNYFDPLALSQFSSWNGLSFTPNSIDTDIQDLQGVDDVANILSVNPQHDTTCVIVYRL